MILQYPKALYHATLPAALVNDPVEHERLGPGWYESPADVPSVAEAATAEPPAGADTVAADTAGYDTLAAEIVALNAKDAIDLLASIEAAAALVAIDAAERAGKARQTVLAALEARAAALGAAL